MKTTNLTTIINRLRELYQSFNKDLDELQKFLNSSDNHSMIMLDTLFDKVATIRRQRGHIELVFDHIFFNTQISRPMVSFLKYWFETNEAYEICAFLNELEFDECDLTK